MLAFDVVEDILLTLDVKDLLRCKSVCKSWYSLISSPLFVKLHVKFVRNKDEKNNKQLGNRRIATTRRFVIRNGECTSIPEEWQGYSSLYIQGSCNGLVCICSCGNLLALTNPSTREFRKVHMPPMLPKSAYIRRYGFGYDSSTDDYKLFMAIKQGSDGTLVQILSLKSNVWKQVGHVNYSFGERTPGVLFNGSLHWFFHNAIGIHNPDIKEVFLVSFDLANEQFREIPQPDDTRYVWSRRSKLGIIEDHLCIFQQRTNGRPHGIWVMKNYSLEESWKLLPTNCEMKDRVHYMIKDCLLSTEMPSYSCSENTSLSTSGKYMWSPIFVQTLVSPYVNNHGQSDAKKNQMMIVNAGNRKDMLEIEEAYTLKNGEKNAYGSDDEDDD